MRSMETVRDDLSAKKPLTVGAIAGREALSRPAKGCEIIELRLDSLGTGPGVQQFAEHCPLPLLITARGPAEGGQTNWTVRERAAAYLSLLPYASLIDIELGDFDSLAEVIHEAREAGVIIVGSFHDFQKTPPVATLLETWNPCADLHKFALMAHCQKDIIAHLELIEELAGAPSAVMGMGSLGAAARPLMAKAGSLLNYGYLGTTPTAPHQWPVELLRQAIAV